MAQSITGIKLWIFLIKWWMFGRTFCNIPLWAKKIAKFMCKILWMIMTFSTICVIMRFVFGIDILE